MKNEDNILPLKPGTRVALIGDFAFEPRYQGAGSSMVNATTLDKMAELIKEYDLILTGCSKGYVRTGEEDAVLAKEQWILHSLRMWCCTVSVWTN